MMTQTEKPQIKVWDPLIRIGHLVLIVGFVIAYLTEGEPEWLHTFAGYAIAVTVAIRILWGVVGPRRARFTDFVTSPFRALDYLRALIAGRSPRYVGHSPAGGVMVVALLASLAVTAFAGMATLASEDGRGPLAGIIQQLPQDEMKAESAGHEEEGEEGEENAWKEVHGLFANLTLVLVLFHLGGVALASYRHHENLPRSMVTGYKRAE